MIYTSKSNEKYLNQFKLAFLKYYEFTYSTFWSKPAIYTILLEQEI